MHRVIYERMVDDTENHEVRRVLDVLRVAVRRKLPALLRERAARAHGQFRAGAAARSIATASTTGSISSRGSDR
jgi:hypothetical protein